MAKEDSETSVPFTEDGHHIIVNGRKWRATNPGIPENLRQELVDELMAARRAVRAKEEDARFRVNNAKIALGERGAPWWEPLEGEALDQRATATIRALLAKRDGKSICPSDVARVIAPQNTDWRDLMAGVRTVAHRLNGEGEVRTTQRGEPVDALTARGPIRIYPSAQTVGSRPSAPHSDKE